MGWKTRKKKEKKKKKKKKKHKFPAEKAADDRPEEGMQKRSERKLEKGENYRRVT